MRTELLCTLGPASMNEATISRLEKLGVRLFRLNLSHTSLAELESTIEFVTSRTDVPLCLDTEGAQIRTGSLANGPVVIRENALIRVPRDVVPGDASRFNLYPYDIVDLCRVGDFLSLDDSVLALVVAVDSEVLLKVLHGGQIAQRKAVTLHRDLHLPPLTDKDRKALAIGREMGISYLALSFANRSSDVDEIRNAFGAEAFVISKIESVSGVVDLAGIAAKSDALLIDRGDLSRQVPVEQIPAVQKHVITYAKQAGKKVYVATNLMESMVTSAMPSRAEVNDVYNTLVDGADGLVLAAESAVGRYPVACAAMVIKIIREFEKAPEHTLAHLGGPHTSLLVEPHGGSLQAKQEEISAANADGLPVLTVSDTAVIDCRQLAAGAYSPLTGFMTRDELESVLKTYRLPGGLPWPTPIVLQVDKSSLQGSGRGDRVALADPGGRIHAVIDISDTYAFEPEAVSLEWFGTSSTLHPGVQRLVGGGRTLVAGEVYRVGGADEPGLAYELTPAEARFAFAQKGWHQVIGYLADEIPHRGHEFSQIRALAATHSDGLLISPMAGPETIDGVASHLIWKSYQRIVDFGVYPGGHVVIGGFATYPRHTGPREQVFHALCFKNMGCSHFLTSPVPERFAGLYENRDVRALFEELGDLGLTPVFSNAVGYNPKKRVYGKLGKKNPVPVNSATIQAALRDGKDLPDWAVRDIVRDVLATSGEITPPEGHL